MTGAEPFREVKRIPAVIVKVQQGKNPVQPKSEEVVRNGLDDELWKLMIRCWYLNPQERPTINQVCEELSVISQRS
jgi:K+ transporter